MKKLIIILMLLIGCSEATNPSDDLKADLTGRWMLDHNRTTDIITIKANDDNIIWDGTKFPCVPKRSYLCETTSGGLELTLSFTLSGNSIYGYMTIYMKGIGRDKATFSGTKIKD